MWVILTEQVEEDENTCDFSFVLFVFDTLLLNGLYWEEARSFSQRWSYFAIIVMNNLAGFCSVLW